MSDDYELVRRDVIEGWLRAAIKYGWTLGNLGLTLPDVLSDWTNDCPQIIAAIVEKEDA